jgi:XTP/dITP diphosphohydrolase
LLATRSAGKMRELRALLREAGLEVIDLVDAGIPEGSDEDALEAYESFEANALAKADHFHALSGLPTLADDSGLEVDALGGEPGVRSKRWSERSDLAGQALDDANNALLLMRLNGLDAPDDRVARYVCAAAFVDGDRRLVERGETAGWITREPRGTGGFGYDPYFHSSDLERTFAEVAMEEKARVSHRSRAFAKLLRRMVDEP